MKNLAYFWKALAKKQKRKKGPKTVLFLEMSRNVTHCPWENFHVFLSSADVF